MVSTIAFWRVLRGIVRLAGISCVLHTVGVEGIASAARSVPPTGNRGVIAEACQAPFPSDWRPSEQWAWGQICASEQADFNVREGRDANVPLSPIDQSGWDTNREIRPAFLATILLTEPYRSAIPNIGAFFKGAWITGPLALGNAKLPALLGLEWSKFESDVDLSGTMTKYPVYLDDSWIRGSLSANSARLGAFTWPGLYVDGTVDLTGAHIAGYLWASNACVWGVVAADLMKVDGDANIDGVYFANSTGPTNFENATFKSLLDVSGSVFYSLDLTGATVAGELILGRNSEAKWSPNVAAWYLSPHGKNDVQLTLRGTTVASWTANKDGWPLLYLAGFKYSYFNILELKDSTDIVDWGITTFLANDRSGSLQPYEQFAATLSARGFGSNADDVRYAERDYQRINSSGMQRLILTMSWLFIGYGCGFGYFRALAWMAGLVVIARTIVWLSRENECRTKPIDTLYCIDVFVPFLQLRGEIKEITVNSRLLFWYLIFHRAAGYLLGSFVLAGIAGLTK